MCLLTELVTAGPIITLSEGTGLVKTFLGRSAGMPSSGGNTTSILASNTLRNCESIFVRFLKTFLSGAVSSNFSGTIVDGAGCFFFGGSTT